LIEYNGQRALALGQAGTPTKIPRAGLSGRSCGADSRRQGHAPKNAAAEGAGTAARSTPKEGTTRTTRRRRRRGRRAAEAAAARGADVGRRARKIRRMRRRRRGVRRGGGALGTTAAARRGVTATRDARCDLTTCCTRHQRVHAKRDEPYDGDGACGATAGGSMMRMRRGDGSGAWDATPAQRSCRRRQL
jgi:hypothetical protein